MSLSQQSGKVPPGKYDAFRSNGFPTYYGEIKTAWQADIVEAGIFFSFCILALAFFFIMPGFHGKQRICKIVWATVSLFIGASILVTNYSQDWESSSTRATTKYKAGTGKDINASIGVHIGLRGINITLKGEPVHQLNETINYNEEFSWSWRQGRLGFGPFASEFNQEYRAAQFRGLPLPILWIAEYFTLDGEGIRWGRLYRESGLYAHMLLWLALPLWLLSNILFLVLLRYGAYFLIMTGTCMLTANVIKHYLRNTLDLTIPFSATHVLVFHYGAAFWLCLVTGCICLLCGALILAMDLRAPTTIANFFGVDVRQDDYYISREESQVSHSTGTSFSSATNENSSDLLEIVELDNSGLVSKVSKVRTDLSANTTKSTSSSQSADSGCKDADWTDYSSSESELEPTDDEWEMTDISKQKGSKGVFQRFQRPRQRPSRIPRLQSKTKTVWRDTIKNPNDKNRVSPTSIRFRPRNKLFCGKISPTSMKS